MCSHIFRTFVNYLIPVLSWNECNMLLIIHYLYTYLHLQFWHSRRSRIYKQPPEVFLIFFANFKGKHLCWSLFFTKLKAFRPATLLKTDSYTSVFLWNLTNSEEHYFEEHLNDCFCVLITSSYIDFYNPLQYTFYIFTNNFFFIAQLKQ